MTLKASDLSDDVKRPLSKMLRDKIGHSTYDQMANALGEDAVLDMALHAMKEHSSSDQSKKSDWSWLGTVLWIAFMVLAGAFPAIWAIFLGGMILYWIVQALSIPGGWEVFAGILICIVVLGVIGVLAYLGVPWLFSGVGQWWSWLAGHF